MAVCFAAWAVSDLESLRRERYDLFKAGLSPLDWGRMTRWQRADLLARHKTESEAQMKQVSQHKFSGAMAVIVKQLLKL